MKRIMLLVMSAMIALVITGCEFEESCYKTLTIAEQLYVVTMETSSDLYDEHLIQEDARDEIIAAAKLYKASFTAAKVALEVYHNGNKSDTSVENIFTAISTLVKSADDLYYVYNKVTEVGGLKLPIVSVFSSFKTSLSSIEGYKEWKKN